MLANTQKYHMALLLIIILIGAFFRFYDLQTLPPGLYPDEAMNGTNALQAIYNTDFSAKGGPALGWKLFYQENKRQAVQ